MMIVNNYMLREQYFPIRFTIIYLCQTFSIIMQSDYYTVATILRNSSRKYSSKLEAGSSPLEAATETVTLMVTDAIIQVQVSKIQITTS